MPADCATRNIDNEDKESWFPSHVSRERYEVREHDATWIIREMWQMPSACAVAEVNKSLEARFREQAAKWEQETAHLSSPLQRMMHPSYQAILGMGAEHKRDVVRFMLRDLQQNQRDWFLALSYLTQANPINPKDAGRTGKLVSSWLKWGREQGLL